MSTSAAQPPTTGSGSSARRALLVATLCASWAVLRIAFSAELPDARWARLLDGTAPAPFGARPLVPWLARPVASLTGWSPGVVFGLFEFGFTLGLFCVLRALLERMAPPRLAWLFAVGFLLLLPWPYLLSSPLLPPIFYPYDTPALFFLAAGLWCITSGRWGLALVCVAVASANRETAVLIPLCALALLPAAQRRRALLAIGLMFALYFAVVLAIDLWLPDAPGGSIRLQRGHELRVVRNLRWLGAPHNALVLLASLAFTPVLWVALGRWLPPGLRRLRFPAFALFLACALMGNLWEARIFGELVLLLWVPIAAGVARWLEGVAPPSAAASRSGGPLAWLDRFGVSLGLGFAALGVGVLAMLAAGPGLAEVRPGTWEGCVSFRQGGERRLVLPPGVSELSLGGRTLVRGASREARLLVRAGFQPIRVRGSDFRGVRVLGPEPGRVALLDPWLTPLRNPSPRRCADAVLRRWGLELRLPWR